MGEALIRIGLRDGKVIVKSQLDKIIQSELSLLITHLELLQDELKVTFRAGCKQGE